MSEAEQNRFLRDLETHELRALVYLFDFWAHAHQLPPAGDDWRTWVILGGRGSGKTRAGAEWVRAEVEGSRPLDPGRSRRVALIGETIDQAREVMVFGESGILACTPPDRMPVWQASRKRLVWPNGAEAQLVSAHDPESLRGPQFDAAWSDEIGCPAVDKGPNEPNRFHDTKSSESGLPHYSTGVRDDLVQMQFLRATASYWEEAGNNPVSGVYGAPMLDTGRIFVWTWDARPFPAFPTNGELWSDGDNYALGHWLNGRISNRALGPVIREIAASAGVDVSTGEVFGLVRGYLVDRTSTAREALQPLMLAFGIESAEREGTLRFFNRTARVTANIDLERVARVGDLQAGIERIRVPEVETPGRLRLTHVEADGDYAARTVEAVFPGDRSISVAENEFPLVLTGAEGRAIVERWMTEARVSQDRLRLALPPSVRDAGAGSVIGLGDGTRWRIDRTEASEVTLAEAVRVEPSVYVPGPVTEAPAAPLRFVPAAPVYGAFLDLPLLTGDEVPHAPHVVVAADPWSGPAAVYGMDAAGGFGLIQTVASPATLGLTESALPSAPPGRWDRGAPLVVRLTAGALSSADADAVLAGANVAAVGDPDTGVFEVFQFADAALVAEDTWAISRRLRGQAGSDGLMPATWPAGSLFVLLDESIPQLDLAASARGLSRTYRIGPASRPVSDAVYEESDHAFEGRGLRPYAPVHLRARRASNGDLAIGWIRRTRIDGDAWTGHDVPLGENSESYVVRVIEDESVRREEIVSAPEWTWTAAMQSADALTGTVEVEVAQISDRFGPGYSRRIFIDV